MNRVGKRTVLRKRLVGLHRVFRLIGNRLRVSEKGFVMKVMYATAILIMLNACSVPGNEPPYVGTTAIPVKDLLKNMETPGVQADYRIRSGDELGIKFFFNQELNEENLIVRPDGHISLQLVNEVLAAGLTPKELKHLLEEKYRSTLSNPEVAVIVRSVKVPNQVYVDGDVDQPGAFEIVGSLTVLQAIALARGLKDTASQADVVVIRRVPGQKPMVIKLDLKSALTGRDLSQDIYLQPSDLVYVPRSFW